MRRRGRAGLFVAAALLAAGPGHPGRVDLDPPGFRGGPDPAGESLDVTVRDIDLAGLDRPSFATPSSVRVVTDAKPPRICFAYALTRGGRIVAQGEGTGTDTNFLLTPNPRFSTGGLYDESAPA